MDWLAYVTEMTELGIRNNTHTGSWAAIVDIGL